VIGSLRHIAPGAQNPFSIVENPRMEETMEEATSAFGDYLGRGDKMRELIDHMSTALTKTCRPDGAAISIIGESGTGKELIAQALHQRRSLGGVFVHADGATTGSTELFGRTDLDVHVGATSRKGAIPRAERGTLYVENVERLSQRTQRSLLRFVETRQPEEPGGAIVGEPMPTVLVVVSSERSLAESVRSGNLLASLAYAVGGYTVSAPPLRDCEPRHVKMLADIFLKQACERTGRSQKAFDQAAYEFIFSHRLGGNGDELASIIMRGSIHDELVVSAADLEQACRH